MQVLTSFVLLQQIKSSMLLSTPDLGIRTHRVTDSPGPLTLFGAPCNVDPPFSKNELKLWYRGCQNVPTEVWLRTFFSATSNSAPTVNSASAIHNNFPSTSRDTIRASAINTRNTMNGGNTSGGNSTPEEILLNSLPTT